MWSHSLTSDILYSLYAEYRGVHAMYGLLFINIKLNWTLFYPLLNHKSLRKRYTVFLHSAVFI